MVRASREGIQAVNPDKRPFVLTRSNFLGGHRYAATWTGDNASDWDHLRWSIPMALNLGLSGQPFVGPDIGGFAGDADGHLFARWMGIGALLPFARGHSIKGSRDHEPWSFGPRCERVCRLALERRYRLLPYLYTLFREASQTGMPVVRPLFFADPTDPALRGADDAFLLGDDVLVRSRTSFTGIWGAPMPAGRWVPFEPASNTDRELPDLFIREGAVVPLGPVMQYVGEKPLDPLTLVINPDAGGCASGLLYEDAGDGFGFERGEYRLTRFTATTSAKGVAIEQTILDGGWPSPQREIRTLTVG
jgi:alpha-glucosidase